MPRFRALMLVSMLLAACSGGSPATQAPSTTAAGSTFAASTPGTASTTGPAATGAAGGDAAWCLNTAPEVEAALHVSGVVAAGTTTAGLGGGCIYSLADSTPIHAVSVVNSPGFEATFDAGKTTPGVVEISGIGKGALLMSAAGPLVILTDNGLISMGPLGPADLLSDAAAYRTAVEALGKAAVGRMP
jgi:hypothetical protein